MNTRTAPHTLTRQAGASLIELMVGLTIGLFVLLAAIGTLVLTRTSGTVVADSSAMIAQGNNAMRLVAFHLRQSGAIEVQPIDPALPPGDRRYTFSDAFNGNNGAGLVVQGTEGGAGPDTLTISYENRGAAITRDCLGQQTAAGLPRVQNRFSLTNNTLDCLGSGNANAQPVADNVEDFQVLYWVQQGAAPNQTQFRRQADQVVAAGGWANVVAVDVCLQMRGEMSNHPVIAGTTFLNCRDGNTAHDGRQRQIFRSTLYLRNQGQ